MGVWFTTWPSKTGGIEYAEHPTEAAAAQHAKWLIDSDTTKHATYFELPIEENR